MLLAVEPLAVEPLANASLTVVLAEVLPLDAAAELDVVLSVLVGPPLAEHEAEVGKVTPTLSTHDISTLDSDNIVWRVKRSPIPLRHERDSR